MTNLNGKGITYIGNIKTKKIVKIVYLLFVVKN
jgi:hypothetical protein